MIKKFLGFARSPLGLLVCFWLAFRVVLWLHASPVNAVATVIFGLGLWTFARLVWLAVAGLVRFLVALAFRTSSVARADSAYHEYHVR